ncbi:hypothetical protein EVAR_91882_1, partial [Eumeta japonica]
SWLRLHFTHISQIGSRSVNSVSFFTFKSAERPSVFRGRSIHQRHRRLDSQVIEGLNEKARSPTVVPSRIYEQRRKRRRKVKQRRNEASELRKIEDLDLIAEALRAQAT